MRTRRLVLVGALLVISVPVGACDEDTHSSFSRQTRIEGRSWGVQGYRRYEYKGKDAQGNRFGGRIETLPSGTFRYRSWSKPNPVPGRVQRFLESRR